MLKDIYSTEEGKLLLTPRLYTEDKWCSLLTIDNFHTLPCYSTRTFMFSTHSSLADCAGTKLMGVFTFLILIQLIFR